MCGIVGFIRINKADYNVVSVVNCMTESLAHRGPDGSGYDILNGSGVNKNYFVALGHRRLKIIDLTESGRQPMVDPVTGTAITFNGEVYNYIELKEELKCIGHRFVSTSDTEVVLKAYAQWGTACFKRFNGMWALAIFDKRAGKVILSRDRFGKKPLYYYKTEDEFIFASEIKALLRHPSVVREPNYDKIFRYIATNYRYVDIDNDSYFSGIFHVPKSSFMEIDENLKSNVSYYWELRPSVVEGQISDSQAIERFRDLLVDSVNLRLRSDVPIGCMLSGGLDSTSITSIAYKILKKPIVTFSGITGEKKGVYDESEYIDSVIKETNANFHYIRPDPEDIFDATDEMIGFHDEPICTVTWYSLYLIAKKVKFENTPVVLNGHGGDELLAGYWDHYHYNFYDLAQEGDKVSLEHEILAWKGNHSRDPLEIERYKDYIDGLVAGRVEEMSRFIDYSDCFQEDLIHQYKRKISWTNPYSGFLSRRLCSEMMFETIPASLRPEDRNTMSQSIESRSPFLDYRLVEYCFSLPNKFKIRNGLGKWVLRESMKGILPENVRTRKDKSGFIAPADEWFRTINKGQIFRLINSDSFRRRGLFNIAKTNVLFEEHLCGFRNHQMFLWQLINLELWFRRFFDDAKN